MQVEEKKNKRFFNLPLTPEGNANWNNVISRFSCTIQRVDTLNLRALHEFPTQGSLQIRIWSLSQFRQIALIQIFQKNLFFLPPRSLFLLSFAAGGKSFVFVSVPSFWGKGEAGEDRKIVFPSFHPSFPANARSPVKIGGGFRFWKNKKKGRKPLFPNKCVQRKN